MPIKKTEPETKKSTQRILLPFPIRLTKAQIERLDEIAKIEQSNRPQVAREAIQFFLDNYEINEQDKRQTKLHRRIEQLDGHLSSLLVKTIRVSAQNLYFSTLPYVKGGLPKQPISTESLYRYYEYSGHFGAEFLKSKGTLPINVFDPDWQTKNQPSEPPKNS